MQTALTVISIAVLAVVCTFLIRRTVHMIREMLGYRGKLPRGAIVPMAVGMLAKKLEGQGDIRGALAVYEKFLADHPDSVLGLNNAASLLLELGNGQKAKEYLERAMRIDSDYESAQCNLAEAKLMLKDLVGARQAFQQTVKVHPDSVGARMGLGRLFMEVKNGKMACEHLGEAVRLQPQNPAAWHNLGAACLLEGDLNRAEEAFQQVLKLDPHSAHGREGLARVKQMREMAANARATGAVLTTGDAVVSDRSRTLVCHVCGRKYVEHGQVSLERRSLGGALCRSCGKFYCEACVARVVLGERKTMSCQCGRARAPLGADGSLRFEGFEELVVFQAP